MQRTRACTWEEGRKASELENSLGTCGNLFSQFIIYTTSRRSPRYAAWAA